MSQEQEIQSALVGRFPELSDKVSVRRDRRILAEVPLARLHEVIDFAVKDLGFNMVSAITGLDERERFAVLYHLNRKSSMMLTLRTILPKDNPVIDTVSAIFPSADIYERELVDLLGIRVQGLPEGRRYPLPDDAPCDIYPLRKPVQTQVPQEQKGETS